MSCSTSTPRVSSVAVIVEIEPRRLASAAIPSEDQPPLPIDADRVEVRQSAVQLLEVIAGRHAQVQFARRVVDHLQLPEQPALEVGWNVAGPHVVAEEGAQPVVPETGNHTGALYRSMVQVASARRLTSRRRHRPIRP